MEHDTLQTNIDTLEATRSALLRRVTRLANHLRTTPTPHMEEHAWRQHMEHTVGRLHTVRVLLADGNATAMLTALEFATNDIAREVFNTTGASL